MATKKKLSNTFYQNLGKLFYAVAASDGTVKDVEFEELKVFIKQYWLHVDDLEDAFGTDAAYQIEVVFDRLNREEELNIKACYNDFVTYKNNQNHLFTKNVKKLILKTAIALAESFSGKNKSELMLLAKLNIELNKE